MAIGDDPFLTISVVQLINAAMNTVTVAVVYLIRRDQRNQHHM